MHSIFSSIEDFLMVDPEDTNLNPATSSSSTTNNANNNNNSSTINSNSQTERFYASLKDYTTNDTFLKLLDFTLVPTKDTEIATPLAGIPSARTILKGDRTVYCTQKKRNVNLLFKFNDKEQRYFVLTHLIIKVPENYSTKGSPLCDGLLFVSHEPIDIIKTKIYNNLDERKWELFLEQKKQNNEVWKAEEPALYFKFKNNSWCLIKQLSVPRAGRYVLLKLLKSRNRTDPIEVQYVGFKGFVGKASFYCGSLL
jgi:hypothetical protein